MEEMKKCPHCGHEIKAVAKKCRYCGKWLDEVGSPASVTHSTTHNSKGNTLKYLLFGIGTVIIIAVVVWIMNRSASEGYSSGDNSYSRTNTPEELIEEVPDLGNPIEEVPEYILTHDADGNGVWIKNPDYIDGSHLYDGTEYED